MKRNFLLALALALALHALLAAALALFLGRASAPDELAELDLTSVDLSFAETVEETVAAVSSAPSQPAAPSPPAPKTVETKPAAVAAPAPVPHEPEAKLPDIGEPFVAPEVEVVRQEARDESRRETQDESPAETKPEPQAENRPAAPAAQAAPRQAHVDAPPKPRRNIRPDYPRGARERGEQGSVLLEITVGADGAVTEARVVSSPGFAELDAAALAAVRKARFTPAKADGRPVASTARLTLQFKLK